MSRYHANELLNNRKNDIQHWKYVKKIPVGKGYRYFYSWAEYKAYLADPVADLKKAGNTAKSEIKKAGKKSYSEVKIRGRKAVEKVSSKSKSSNLTLSAVKAKNKSRDTKFKGKINNLAKKASEKWNGGKEKIKDTVKKGKNWIEDKIEEIKEERKRKKEEKEKKQQEEKKKKQEKLEKQREKIAQKYKYLKRIKIGDRFVYFYSQDEIDNYNRQKDYMANEPKFMKDLNHSKVPYSSAEDAIQVNPKHNFYDWDDRYENNCAECTAIYELRRRGYDVESNGESAIGWNWEKYNTDARYGLFYKNAKINRLPVAKNDKEALANLEKEFAKMPPGSRGDISFIWKEGGGHSVAWEKDSKGKIHIIDTQLSGHGNKIEYSMEDLVKSTDNTTKYKRGNFGGDDGKYFNAYKSCSATRITRTDNLELKPEIKNICQNTDKKKRAKPNTNSAWDLDLNNNQVTPRAMTEEEIVKNYYNLTY